MLKEERLDFILQKLHANQVVKLGDLSLSLNVSEDTIRRDIETLDRNGLCSKVRGGAVPHSPNKKQHSFKERVNASEEQKTIIAQKALELIQPGSTILLDGGTTTFKLASLLPLNMPLTVISNSIPVANALMEHPLVEVILAGGRIFKSSQVTMGMETLRLLEKVRVDICFTGICSLHLQLGVTAPNFDESETKRVMLQSANKVVAITTHDKIGTAESFKVCDLADVDTIITEISNTDESFAPYKALGIQIL
ncbi:MAG: DeoR/GlpR family DNA-binding transcription regulator [Bacteroidota bacterium]